MQILFLSNQASFSGCRSRFLYVHPINTKQLLFSQAHTKKIFPLCQKFIQNDTPTRENPRPSFTPCQHLCRSLLPLGAASAQRVKQRALRRVRSSALRAMTALLWVSTSTSGCSLLYLVGTFCSFFQRCCETARSWSS